MTRPKGYVVRWTDPWSGEARAAQYDGAGALGTAEYGRLERSERHGARDARIFAVTDAGETPLPSYGEALAEVEKLRTERDAERKAWAGLLDAETTLWCAALRAASEGGDVAQEREQRAAAKQALRDLGVNLGAALAEAAKKGAAA